ncbi:MAG TPA: DNA mismatch repair endonuclease MutL, partial [Candidatus Izemoplasmatales bacterium]|nr:DNA mismatch repair endonuclease MutL [Candidatus Izemoplasmatales bacterium]
QAFQRHATSKIKSVNDLFRITSLGFRGEAIPSIASIAKVTITSNPNDHAKTVVFDNGQFIEMKDASFNQGTKVEVEKIFYYTPARFKYLKSEPYELAMIQNLMYQFALAYPNVSFRLTNNQKLIFNAQGDGNIQQLLAQIYGTNVGKSLLTFSGQSRDYNIHGLTSKPVVNRSNRHYMHIIVNHRVIQDPAIARAILESYDQLIPKQRYPIVALYIDVDPILIDVNVHPRKQEIKFSEKKSLLELIRKTISTSLYDKPIFQEVASDDVQTTMAFEYEPTEETLTSTVAETPKANIDSSNIDKKDQANKIPDMSYIGQYHGTYLLFQNDQGLFMVDQHAGAERIRYERYIKEMERNNQFRQSTIFPITMNFPKDVMTQLKSYQEDIATIGIKCRFVDDAIHINEIPHWFPKGFEDMYIEAIIDGLINEKEVSKKSLIDDLAKLLSCKHSLKANHYITEKEAFRLIQDLNKCEKPYTCPHGRPIVVKVKHGQVEHWFNRVI